MLIVKNVVREQSENVPWNSIVMGFFCFFLSLSLSSQRLQSSCLLRGASLAMKSRDYLLPIPLQAAPLARNVLRGGQVGLENLPRSSEAGLPQRSPGTTFSKWEKKLPLRTAFLNVSPQPDNFARFTCGEYQAGNEAIPSYFQTGRPVAKQQTLERGSGQVGEGCFLERCPLSQAYRCLSCWSCCTDGRGPGVLCAPLDTISSTTGDTRITG